MRVVLILFAMLSCSLAAAIENTFKAEEDAKAKSPIAISFRVTDVQYEQEGDLLFTFATAKVLSVGRGAPIEIKQTETIIEVLNYDQRTTATVKLSRL